MKNFLTGLFRMIHSSLYEGELVNALFLCDYKGFETKDIIRRLCCSEVSSVTNPRSKAEVRKVHLCILLCRIEKPCCPKFHSRLRELFVACGVAESVITLRAKRCLHSATKAASYASLRSHSNVGIGNGKSTVSNISCLYEIYKLLCMKDPQSYYKLLKSTIITFVIFSANKYTAENVNWPQLKAAFEDSPWFQEHCPIVDEGKRVALDKDNCVSLPKNIAIQLGSNEKHALGKAVIWGVVDEANFQSENSHQAYNSYNAIAQRRTSRFQDADTALKLFYYFSKKDRTS